MFIIKNRIIFLSIIIIISNLSFISNKNFVTNPSFETPGGMVNAEGWSADNWGCWTTNTTAHTENVQCMVKNLVIIFGK